MIVLQWLIGATVVGGLAAVVFSMFNVTPPEKK